MAYNPVNFRGLADNNYSEIGDLPNKLVEAYRSGPKYRQEMERSKYENIIKEAQSRYAEPLANAQIENLQASAWAHRNPQLSGAGSANTALMKELISAGYGPGTPEFQQAVGNAYGISLGAGDIPEGLPEESRPLSILSKPEQAAESKFTREETARVNKLKTAVKVLNEMKSLQQANPNLSGEFRAIIADPDDRGILGGIKRAFSSEKDRAAVEKMDKLSSDLVSLRLEGLGGRATNARQALISQSKAKATNTNEANLFMIDHALDELSFVEPYSKALQSARTHRYAIPLDEDYYRNYEQAGQGGENGITPKDKQVKAIQNAQSEKELLADQPESVMKIKSAIEKNKLQIDGGQGSWEDVLDTARDNNLSVHDVLVRLNREGRLKKRGSNG